MKAEVWSEYHRSSQAITAWGIWPRTSEYYERSSWAGELFEERGGPLWMDPAPMLAGPFY